jgi:phosphoenolpyruvate-protein phosphotransferase (PTS system enzyme I)
VVAVAAGTVLTGMGVGLSPVTAEVFRVHPPQALPGIAKHQGDVEAQKSALQKAIANVARHLDELGEKAGETSAEIFEALKMLLEDEDLFETAVGQIESGFDAASSFILAVDEFGELLSGDAAFEERVVDLKDLAKRVAADIHGIHMGLEIPTSGAYVLVGEDFSPADTAQFTSAVVGVITLKGGPTSHTAIICRSKSIPALVSCPAAAELIDGQLVLVDPVGDRAVVDGDVSMATKTISFVPKFAEPIIPVRANIGSEGDAIQAGTTAANGVGLFRTELLYLSQSQMPTIEAQVELYVAVLHAAPEGPVVVRTIDAGSDKPVPFLDMPHEENPALGVRGFRLIVDHRQFILDQLTSLEQARLKTGREVWVMAPMIATSQEALEFASLARAAGDFKVGIMVETPSIVMALTDLADQLDFVSVGTNDLSQYLFAADRMNPALGALLNPWQPALIRALEKIAKDSLAGNMSPGVCGESASDPAFAVVLAGLGFKSVSASMSQVGAVRTALSAVTTEQAQRIAQLAIAATSPEAAKAAVLDALNKL